MGLRGYCYLGGKMVDRIGDIEILLTLLVLISML